MSDKKSNHCFVQVSDGGVVWNRELMRGKNAKKN